MRLKAFKLLSIALFAFVAHGAISAQEVQQLNRGSYKNIVAAHTGKPFIVALWSVSCTHCGADLEIFNRLAMKYPEFNLVLISTDTPDELPVIDSTLKRYQLLQPEQKHAGRVEAWVFADSYTERLRFEIDSQWYGELPRTYFYDTGVKPAP